MGALDTAVRAGQGAVRRHQLLLARAHASEAIAILARARHPAADPPALLLAAQPLDRGRSCSTCSSARGRRRIVVLAARPGPADRPLPRRRPRGLARAPRRALRRARCSARRTSSRVRALNEIAARRGQSLAQMAIAWVLRDPRVTSALIGASSVEQLEQNVAALRTLDFSDDELAEIDRHAVDGGDQHLGGVERRLSGRAPPSGAAPPRARSAGAIRSPSRTPSGG